MELVFVFNYYLHQSSLVLRNGDGKANIPHSREVVTQGEPLAMVICGIEFFPLIKQLRSTYADIMQPRYADDARALGTFNNLEQYSNSLKRNALDQGELTRSHKNHYDRASKQPWSGVIICPV